MIRKIPTVSPYLDIRRTVAGQKTDAKGSDQAATEKKHPVTIRVTYDRKTKYYTTNYHLTVEEYAKIWKPKPRREFKDILTDLKALEKKANDVIRDLEPFTFKAFEAKYLKVRSKWNDAFTAFEDYIKELDKDGRVGTAYACKCALNSFKSFTEREKLSFAAIDVRFLKKYEAWMLTNERSVTTIGIYMRALRTIFNRAIQERIVNKDLYPFGSNKNGLYDIPVGRNIKKALTLQEIKSIFDYLPEDEFEARSKDFWIFIYLSNGINPKDLARLKYKDLDEGFIRFKRAKTARTKKGFQKIEIPIQPPMPEIIQRWGNTYHPDNYIFPILEHRITPQRERELVQNFNHNLNKQMKRIGEALGIKIPLTTYVARHSFATVLKRSGASAEFIGEALGHNNLKTTQAYLASFEDDQKIKTARVLTNFKDIEESTPEPNTQN